MSGERERLISKWNQPFRGLAARCVLCMLCVLCILDVVSCKPRGGPPAAEPPAFTPASCPESRLQAFPHPPFGALGTETYTPGVGTEELKQRLPLHSTPTRCAGGETDDDCASRAEAAFRSSDEARDMIANARGRVIVDCDVTGAPGHRVASPYAALLATIHDEPRLDVLFTTTAGDDAVQLWARGTQKTVADYRIVAHEAPHSDASPGDEQGTAATWTITVRCRHPR